jgi:tRNA G26 N,N-dimethylase Trm1
MMKEDEISVLYNDNVTDALSGVRAIRFLNEDYAIQEITLSDLKKISRTPSPIPQNQNASRSKSHAIKIMQPFDNAPIVVKIDTRFYQCHIKGIVESLTVGSRFWLNMELHGIESEENR